MTYAELISELATRHAGLISALQDVKDWAESRDGFSETDEHNLRTIVDIAENAIREAK